MLDFDFFLVDLALVVFFLAGLSAAFFLVDFLAVTFLVGLVAAFFFGDFLAEDFFLGDFFAAFFLAAFFLVVFFLAGFFFLPLEKMLSQLSENCCVEPTRTILMVVQTPSICWIPRI